MIAELFDYIAELEQILHDALFPIEDNITAIGREIGVHIEKI